MNESNRDLIVIIRLCQSYLESKGENEKRKQDLIGLSFNMQSYLMLVITKILNEPAKDNKEDQDQEENIVSIVSKASELAIPCIISAMTATKTVPSYKKTVDKALKVAKKHIENICKETECNAQTAMYITNSLIGSICLTSYEIYHREEYKQIYDFIRNHTKKINSLIKLINRSKDGEEIEEYRNERKEVEDELNAKIEQYNSNIYKTNESKQIAVDIVLSLFPHEMMPDFMEQKSEVDLLDNIPTVKTKRINQILLPIDKVSQSIFNGAVSVGETDVPIGTEKKGAKKQYTAYLDFLFDDFKNVQISKKLSNYEKSIHNAIVSLHKKNEWITPYMVYEVITGTFDVNPDSKTLDEIAKILDKLGKISVKINISEDTTNCIDGDKEKYIYEGRLIAHEKITRMLNGKKKEGYRIFREPILYSYAKNKKQIVTVDLKYLKNSIRMTPENVVLHHYLVYRIELMRNKNNSIKSNAIKYETIFEQIEFTQKSASAIRNKKSKLRGFTARILEDLKVSGFIEDFDTQTSKDKIFIKL